MRDKYGQGKLRVGILFGGQSVEHEISILSARNVLQALDRSRFEPVLVGIDKAGNWIIQDERALLSGSLDPRLVNLKSGNIVSLDKLDGDHHNTVAVGGIGIDVVFPVLHGTFGEDGAMQGLLEIMGLPFVGAGVIGSAIGMDKDVMKRLLRDAAISIADFRTVRRRDFQSAERDVYAELSALGFPMFTKPANAGSSVGVRKVMRQAELGDALRHAFRFDSKVIAESAVVGREIEIAVLGGDPPIASVAGEVIVKHPDGFYSYEAKYVDVRGASLELPAAISQDILIAAQKLALRVFDVLECDGMARVDFFLRPDGSLLVNEINTIPGFTAISMFPKLWELTGIPQTTLITRLIDLAIERATRRASIIAESPA